MATPSPSRFYIHDDISGDVLLRFGAGSEALRLTEEIFDLVRRDSDRVAVLNEQEQVDALLARGDHEPFEAAVGIGAAGERVAGKLHERKGWFPSIRRVDVFREEDGRGGYRLAYAAGNTLGDALSSVRDASSLAVVDDTVFSGLTMTGVLRSLPPGLLDRTHAFCLRCAGESLPSVASLCPVSAGFTAPGRILHDVSFINASGLVTRVGIRRADGPPLAFFDRPEWIRAWFPDRAAEVIELAGRLNRILEPAAAG